MLIVPCTLIPIAFPGPWICCTYSPIGHFTYLASHFKYCSETWARAERAQFECMRSVSDKIESQLTRCEFRAVSSLLSFPTTIYTDLFSAFHFSKTLPIPEHHAYTYSIPTIPRIVDRKLVYLEADLSLRSPGTHGGLCFPPWNAHCSSCNTESI